MNSSGLIRNKNRRLYMVRINDDVTKILFNCEFNSSPKHKEISEDLFESFEDIMYLTEKYIGNISKFF